MDRNEERTAFAKACAYLNFNRAAQWTAHAAAVGSCLVYIALLAVLWLFADLMVSRGRLPAYHDVSKAAQDRFITEWNNLPPPADPRAPLTAAAVGVMGDPLGETAVPAGVVVAADRTTNQRVIQLERAGFNPVRSLELASVTAASNMPPDDLDALWRAHLATVIQQSLNVPDARLHEMLKPSYYHEVDHGLLSLVVRSQINRDLQAPVIALIARWNGWLWNLSPEPPWVISLHLTGLLLLSVVLALLGTFFLLLMYEMAARAVIGAAHRFRRAVYHHTIRLGALAFRALGPSEAVSVFTRHIESVHDALFARMTVYYREPIKFCLLLAFALIVHPLLAVAFLLFAVLIWLVGGRIAARFRRESAAARRHAAERLTVIRESLMMMRLVKTYMMEQFNQARVERQLASYSQAQLVRHRGETMPRPLLALLALLCTLLLLYAAGVIVLSGGLGVAGMVALATALVSLYRPAEKWIAGRRTMRRGREAAAELFHFLDHRGDVGQVVGAEFLPPLAERIEFDDVSLKEPGGSRLLLEHVSLTMPAGKRVGIIGADELEKHALVYLIPRLLDPSSGEIRIDKHNLRWVTLDSLRNQIACVLQHNLVFHDTVANNIGCGDPAFTLPKIIEAAKTAHAHHFIQKLPKGYETPIGELGHALSVSERFRIAMARAVLRDPALLIIEEPEKPLDEDSKSLLDDTLARVLPGRTVIFLPHRISTIRSCDVLFLLHKGKVMASGVHKELLAQNPLYRHLHYLEFNEMDEMV
ncbi:MAG TPA: ABC transporter ATP-binding protein [Gemmataceae bacterium]|nr:ABC transporter ATP-binding protein [Gemmataceae bacterium]